VQMPPLNFSDLSLLFALGAIILIITVELASPHNVLTNLTLNKKKLRKVALIIGILFLITIVIQAMGMLT
jgi:hypothetical protein